MKEAPDGRRIFIWRDKEPVEANISRLADAIAERLVAELFDVNGGLFWLEAGGLVSVANLRDLITQHFVSIRLGGTVDKPNGGSSISRSTSPWWQKRTRSPTKRPSMPWVLHCLSGLPKARRSPADYPRSRKGRCGTGLELASLRIVLQTPMASMLIRSRSWWGADNP